MSTAQIVALCLCAVIIGSVAMWRSSEQDAALSRASACVVSQAHAQGYTGNPYSEQAWELFSGDCK